MASGDPTNPDPEEPAKTQLTVALAFYSAARAEIIQRLGLRETTFLAWIATVGVILGIALKNVATPNNSLVPVLTLLEVIPILSLPFAAVIYRHHQIIDYLADSYINGELKHFLRQSENSALRHWDNSQTVKDKIHPFVVKELVIYLIFLTVLPVVILGYVAVSLAYNCSHYWLPWTLWLAGLTCIGGVLVVGVISIVKVRAKEKIARQSATQSLTSGPTS
jgi:hypothetical protein